MKKIGQNMPHMSKVHQFDYQKLVKQIMADPDVVAFIQQEKLTQAEIQRSVSKFNQYITELANGGHRDRRRHHNLR